MEGPYGNAMTEIALALAMAFFSVMVLTMVSMGTGSANRSDAAQAKAPALAQSQRLQIVAAKPETKSAPIASDTRIVVYHAGQFLDTKLASLDPDTIGADETVILAIDPALPLAQAIVVRSQINAAQITITALDQRWMRTLKETNQ